MENTNTNHNITENSLVTYSGHEATVRDVHMTETMAGFLTLRIPGHRPVTVHHSTVKLIKLFNAEADKAYRISCVRVLIAQAKRNGSRRLAELEATLIELEEGE